MALLAVTGIGGLSLVGIALVAGSSGVGLDVDMEFVAVVVLDIVILGVLQARLDRLTVATPFASTAPS